MDNVKVETRFANRLVFGLGAIAVLSLLYFFAPDKNVFYPRCLLHSLTGLSCPFCGSLRATHQLLHGNFQTALALNPLFVLFLGPVLIFISVSKIFAIAPENKTFTFAKSRVSIWFFVGILAVFGVVRNLSISSWPGF